ncbi:hypothetical protein HMPREF1544_09655 [Mucor circinelloides 1006PhL]|uniref:Uncharacterized protein n=1 Tax=Mucor circinelloides f. circinelloides (strain 1006PhL) TaxID=1220926 RepID=S2J5W3_MUCC1|nr:hypothetical protein HMPREF1544_09655 [Mucor circinelloides 1006PhL]KAG1101475.1 hypothetical protein G6F42_017503 [Rhizopus arrhizus]
MQEKFNFFNDNIQEIQCPSMTVQVDQIGIDERIDITQIQQQIATPLQSPDLLKYYYMTQLLRARTNSNQSSQDLEDYMFKELVMNETDDATRYSAE